MAITQLGYCTAETNVIAALADKPNAQSGMTAAQLKAKFDAADAAIKAYINDTLVPYVNSTLAAAIEAPASAVADGIITTDKLASSLVVPIAHGGTGNTTGMAHTIEDSAGGYPLNITWAKSAQSSTDYLASWAVINGTPEIGTIAPGKLSVNWANIADTLASTLPIAKGGTGATTRQTALKNLMPDEIKSPICVYTENGGWNGGYTYLADLAAALGVVSITKLWENASPTSSFAAQTIELDLSGYSHILVVGMVTTTYQVQISTFASKGPVAILTGAWGDTGTTFHRSFNTSNSTIWFDSAYYSYNDGAVSPAALIPYQIYGVKGVT